MHLNPPSRARALALLPLLVFLAIFLGCGIYFNLQGTEYAFYQISAPVAALPAIALAVLLSRERLNQTIETFLQGAGHVHIMAMCFIYLLAGAFGSVAKVTGGVDATVSMALHLIPGELLLPGIFLVAGFISTSMGTSMGTIAALAPIALGLAQSAGLPLALTAGVVVGGAMFGDNLSIISDTTIAATRSQGCQMRDKFRINVFIAVPAALITLAFLYGVPTTPVATPLQSGAWLPMLPYLLILVLAVAGLNVFVVLTTGLAMSGLIGLSTLPDYNMLALVKDIYAGFSSMQEIFLLSMMIGGLGALMNRQGGLEFLSQGIERLLARTVRTGRDGAGTELGIAALVGATNLCTANNTVSIILTGGVAHELATNNGVPARRSASVLDIFSCVCQGLLPYGAQALLAASIFSLSPVAVAGKTYYCMALGLVALVDILRLIFKK
jgi:Na+/H+ antiporter NhaC